MCQEQPLELLLELFAKKYSKVGYSKYHILRSLTFFEDADAEPDPVMLKPWSWEGIKAYFVVAVVRIAKELPWS